MWKTNPQSENNLLEFSYLKFQYFCIYLSWWITSSFRGELFNDRQCKPSIDQSCWGHSTLFCLSLAFSLKGYLFVSGWGAVLLCLQPTWPWLGSGCLQSSKWMWNVLGVFCYGCRSSFAAVGSWFVCLWGSYLPVTARLETTGVQILILWLWTASCSFVLWKMGNQA